MKPARAATICRVAGLAAFLLAPVPFLIFFFRMLTTKVNEIAEEDMACYHNLLSALLFVAFAGVCLGTVLLLVGRFLRPRQRENLT